MARTIEDGGLFRPGENVPTADGMGATEWVPGYVSRFPGPILIDDPGPVVPTGTEPNTGPVDRVTPSAPVPGLDPALLPPSRPVDGVQPGAPAGSTGAGSAPVTSSTQGGGAGGRSSGAGSVSDLGGGSATVTASDPKDAALGFAVVAAAVLFVWWQMRKGRR